MLVVTAFFPNPKHHKISVLPQITPFNFGDDPLNPGDTASVQCTITKGDIPLNIRWYLNGKLVDNFGGISTNRISKRISSLSIDSVQDIHMGDYTCRAKNPAGSADYTTRLVVNGITVIAVQVLLEL